MGAGQSRLAHIALALVPGVGRVRFDALVARFGSAADVLRASQRDLRRIPGIGVAAATAIRHASVGEAARVEDRTLGLGGTLLIPGDPDFPNALGDIPEAPTLLFVLGNLDLLRHPAVGIVGARDHSSYGRHACASLASAVAGAGLVVVSGMARGLDAVAHQAALDVGGKSVGVLGNGLGVVYPAANRTLYERMRSAGCLITEYPPGERPNAGSFPRRNRLISGLSKATVVIEARKGSGALITAQCALNQGREVLAVPGPITSRLSAGTNELIRLGAKPVVEPRDILEEFEIDPDVPSVVLPGDLSDLERRVVELLGEGLSHIDDIGARVQCDMSMSEILATLTSLEIRGLVKQDRRMTYSLTNTFSLL